MTARRHDPIVTAILSQRGFVERTLTRLQAPASVLPDLCQEVTIATWSAARHGRVLWRDVRMLRAFLRVVAARIVYRWRRDNPQHSELDERHEAPGVDAEALVIARSTLRLLRESTTPERWRAIRAYGKGIPVHEIAARERCPVPTVYDRMRRARLDFDAALRREDAAIYVRRKK